MKRIPLKLVFAFGAIASLIAALVFRRNLSAEISLFLTDPAPTTAAEWFTLVQNNGLLGVGLLNIFDSVNYVLLSVMFVSLYFALRQNSRRLVAAATILGIAGVAVYLASSTAFTMLSLSNQYATATDSQKTILLTAGQTVLSAGDPGAIYEGLGGYVSLFLIASAGLLLSVTMLRSHFNRATGYVGMLACVLDLIYIAGLAIVPTAQTPLLAAACLSTAGLLLLVWHLLIGIEFIKLTKTAPMEVSIK